MSEEDKLCETFKNLKNKGKKKKKKLHRLCIHIYVFIRQTQLR